MRPIQYILIVLLLLLLVFFERKLKKSLGIKLLFAGVMLAALTFTIFPDASTVIANYLGIGRGVDLIIYLSLLALLCCCMLLYLRLVKLERTLTELVRQQSLREQKHVETH